MKGPASATDRGFTQLIRSPSPERSFPDPLKALLFLADSGACMLSGSFATVHSSVLSSNKASHLRVHRASNILCASQSGAIPQAGMFTPSKIHFVTGNKKKLEEVCDLESRNLDTG